MFLPKISTGYSGDNEGSWTRGGGRSGQLGQRSPAFPNSIPFIV